MDRVFPDAEWARLAPEEAGFSIERLAAAEQWLHEFAGDEPFRLVMARYGYLVAEWVRGMDADVGIRHHSASKCFYSSLLGIAVAEGRLPGLDAKVVDYYPEMMEVADGEGPKPGRHAFAENAGITFRQLIGNTSGYMKPGERPGERFHYQTFGMNVFTNALATVYGLYDSAEPGRLAGCGRLLDEKIRDPIAGTWDHVYTDFDFAPGAGANKAVYGHCLDVVANARDAARIGHLWLNLGRWKDRQLVPRSYLEEATRTNAEIIAHEPEDAWKYGLGFWVNDHGRLWPDLPHDLFGAWGAGARYIWVSPALDLVIALCPGPWPDMREDADRIPREQAVLARVLDALER
jgi:CubicO group peptidase (beta-lactamase class C family)